jgi:hypothetical protein
MANLDDILKELEDVGQSTDVAAANSSKPAPAVLSRTDVGVSSQGYSTAVTSSAGPASSAYSAARPSDKTAVAAHASGYGVEDLLSMIGDIDSPTSGSQASKPASSVGAEQHRAPGSSHSTAAGIAGTKLKYVHKTRCISILIRCALFSSQVFLRPCGQCCMCRWAQ